MFQAILHIDPSKLTPDERSEVARVLRASIDINKRNPTTHFSPYDVDVRFVESLEGSLPTHIIVGTISGLHRGWGTDHEAMLQYIVNSVNESARPERYTADEFLRLEQAARPVAIMPRGPGWYDDPRTVDPDGRAPLARQEPG